MPLGVLNIIEPTLRSHDGHHGSLVAEFVRFYGGGCRVFADRHARGLCIDGAEIVPRFPRKFRKLFLPFMYANMIRRKERVLVSTAQTEDFLALGMVARLGFKRLEGFTLFVHYYYNKRRKDRFLKSFASRFPEIRIVTPTPGCASILRDFGFQNVTEIPYPFRFTHLDDAHKQSDFSSVLVAGGARKDKGFAQVCAMVKLFEKSGECIPLTIQVSPDQWGEYKGGVGQLVEELNTSGYSHLRRISEALDPSGYIALFRGAIVLQPYDPRTFRDRVSGVTLDALNACAPIVATRGTWTADILDRYNCGVVCDNTEPETLASAVREIHANYSLYRSRATVARDRMRQITESSPIGAILNCP